MKKTIIRIENAIILILVAISLFAIVLTKHDTNVSAATPTITVNKNAAISVYVSGSGVELVNSTPFVDEYSYETGTEFTISSVNETKIFTKYVITDSTSTTDITTPKYSASKSESFSISVEGRSTVTADKGSYMGDRFLLEDDEDLIALQEIIKTGVVATPSANLQNFYNQFLGTTAVNETNYNKIVNGYFLVANNISMFSSLSIGSQTFYFTGIGTDDKHPFNGVICGDVDGINSQVVTVITVNDITASTGNRFGFFGYLGNNAIVRNLKFATSIGVTDTNGFTHTDIYAGGVAGYATDALFVDVASTANISVDLPDSTANVFTGVFVGEANGLNIESISKLSSVRDHASLTVNTKGNNYAGAVAGRATNMYIKELDLDLTGLSIILRNNDSTNNVYGGVLFGYLNNTSTTRIDEAHVTADEAFRLEAYSDTYSETAYTGAYTGGIAGYFNAGAKTTLGNITISNKHNEESVISSNTIDAASKSNCYSGGLFGYINSLTNVVANEDFKDRISEINVDGKIAYNYNPVFTGNISISSTQNGLGDGANYGKAVAGGLVGRGLIDINGTSSSTPTELVLTKEGELKIDATQTRIAKHITYDGTNNDYLLSDYEHCVSSVIFGLISNVYYTYEYKYINIYAERAVSTTTREIGSLANGHILNSGFVSYANGQDFSNITLYYNNCEINSHSLSYETHSSSSNKFVNTDNAHVGGVVGCFNNSDQSSDENDQNDTSASHLMNNVTICGINWDYKELGVGTKLKVYSIQNTKAGSGDCKGENYVGGIIGKLYRNNVSNVKFLGSETDEDYIRMSGHEDPDSAFCGGIIGYINGFVKTSNGELSVSNCEIKNTEVYGEATITDYGNPDIYIGGILGALYTYREAGDNSTSYKFDNLRVIKSNVKALGNEKIRVYSAGVLGGLCWGTNPTSITNCYVSDSVIVSNSKKSLPSVTLNESYAAGIVAYIENLNATVSNNAVIESSISSSQVVAGISAEIDSKTYKNNYSNAILSGESGKIYGISSTGSTSSSNNFYHLQNTGLDEGKGIGTAIDFTKQLVNTENDKVVDNINTAKEYMQYVLEYTNGYKVNGGITEIVNYIYTYYEILTVDEYNNLPTEEEAIKKYLKEQSLYEIADGTYLYYRTEPITNGFNNNKYEVPVVVDGETVHLNGIKQETYNMIWINRSAYSAFVIDGKTYYYHNNNDISYTDQQILTNAGYVDERSNYSFDVDKNVYIANNIDNTMTKEKYDLLADKSSYMEEVKTEVRYETVDNSISFIGDEETSYVDKLHLWVNYKGVGVDIPFDSSKTREELHAEGWFDLGSVIIYNLEQGEINNPPKITDEQVTFTSGDAEYKYIDGVFENQNYPFDEVLKNGYEISNKTYTVKVHDDIPSWKLTFKINKSISLLEEIYDVASDSTETLIDTSSGTVSTYGSYKLSYVISGNDKVYTFEFNPNVNIEQDAKINIKFRLGNSKTLDPSIYTLDIKENKFELVGVKYADYTPVLNNYKYPKVISADINSSYLEGQYRNSEAYYLPAGEIIKFIPVFKRQNDLVVKLYDDERYIELVTFDSDVKSSGELEVGDSGNGTITVTYGTSSYQFDYKISTEHQVTYTVIGMTPEAIPYASEGTDYEFICNVNNGYSGHPNRIMIEVNNKTYSYIKGNATNTLGTILTGIYKKDGTPVDYANNKWDMDDNYYRILINGKDINTDIHITIEFPLVYTVRFDLQTEGFNGTGKEEVKVYKLEDGQLFNDYFNSSMNLEIDNWIKENTIFGYAFTGFYLVAESNTHSSYGIKYDDILAMSNFSVHTSFTFYARWSFLVELVEAPGTTITPSFKDSFMTEINPDDPDNEDYKDLVSKIIRVPLNNKEGYVFTVEKDPTYIGEAEVAAYIITKDGDRQVVTEVTVEKYHKDMYLYHIPSESITGYLMIVTSISNSGFIVGENTATVTEEILPEDGIFTYKYVVNHLKNDTEKTYVYDNGKVDGSTSTLSLNKNFVLYFYEQGYDQTNLVTTKEKYNLPNGTYVEVYYQKFVNQVMTERIVATKKINNSSTHYISLDEFYTIDYQKTSDFKNETFNEFLGNNESVSEVYYVVITPPNGYRQHDNQIKNFIIEGGYENVNCYEAVLTEAEYNTISSLLNSNNIFAYNAKGTKRVEINQAQYDSISNITIKAKFEFVPFIKGIRNGEDFVNKPLEDEQEADFIKYETSRQVKVYSVTPSRITTNTKSGTTYTFTDNKEYQVFNVKYDSEATITLTGDGKKLSLAPNATQDTLISSVLPFNLVSLKFSAGYNTGKIEVYGINGSTKDLMQIVEIDSIEYKDYEVSFIPVDEPTRYNQFELKVVAADEIRLSSLSIVSLTNGMTYSLDDFSKYHQGDTINFSNQIVNDQRHDGKTFMIAVQFKKDGNIVDVPEGVKINVNGTLHNAFVDQDVYGRVTAYFNMSKILDGLSGNSFKYSIEGANGYTYAVQLIEAINPNKPAMSEVRGTIE